MEQGENTSTMMGRKGQPSKGGMGLCGYACAMSEEEWKWPMGKTHSLPRNVQWEETLPSNFPAKHQWVLKNKTPQDLEQTLEEISLAEFIRQGKDQIEETHPGEHVVIWLKFSL